MSKHEEFVDAVFLDTLTGEVLADGETDICGVPPFGIDEHGAWWGTSRAAWVLSDAPTVVEVWGWLGALEWQGFFVGTEEEARLYAEKRRVEVSFSTSEDMGMYILSRLGRGERLRR